MVGFASGSLSSIASSMWSVGAGKFAQSSVGMVTFGTISGGAGASLTGGNFWQGAATGLVVSGLNHLAHRQSVADPKKDYAAYFRSLREGIFDFTSDFSKIPLTLNQEVNFYGSTGWLDSNSAENVILNISAAGAVGSLGVDLGLGRELSMLLGASTAYGNSYTVQYKIHYVNIEQKLWYGKFKHNIFTGRINHVETIKTENSSFNMGYRIDQRVIHNLTNSVIKSSSHSFNSTRNISNNLPKIGGNVYN